MWIVTLIIGFLLAGLIIVGASKLPAGPAQRFSGLFALVVLALAALFSTVVHISADEVGIVVKNIGTKSLKGGSYIAVNGEQGIQADVLTPGWHFWFWPGVYEVRQVPLVEVKAGEVALIETTDGLPLDPGQLFAPEYKTDSFNLMLDALHFLTDGKGRKGAQASVLTAGKYRLNTALFKTKIVKVTEVEQGEVAVLKANFGEPPTLKVQGFVAATGPDPGPNPAGDMSLAGPAQMGVRAEPLHPGKYALNTDAFTVTEIWTTQMIAHYTKGHSGNPAFDDKSQKTSVIPSMDEEEITVRTNDGFTFPVDVRVEYVIEPQNSPVVVAMLGDDQGERFRNVLNSAVRAIFRNNAESVRALDYVQQRSHQESQSQQMLAKQMSRYGVTVTAVRIGSVGDEQSLGKLLETQTDKEIAKQEQLTFQEQQKAAEQQKLLNKAKQESEEEKRLATASYAVKIADETAKQKVAEAEGEAKAIEIRAKAQAEAYELISLQIGKSNAAMIELLKIVGERNIQITPRVMVMGGNGANGSQSGSQDMQALIGTMLQMMVDKEEAEEAKPAAEKSASRP